MIHPTFSVDRGVFVSGHAAMFGVRINNITAGCALKFHLPALRKASWYLLRFCCAMLVSTMLLADAYANRIDDSASMEPVSKTAVLDTTTFAQDTAFQLIIASGLNELIAQVPNSTAEAFESSLISDGLPARFESADIGAVRDAVHDSFTEEVFDRFLHKEMQQTMSEKARRWMLEWYASPLGLRVKQAEIDNTLLRERPRFEAFQQQLSLTEIDPEREQIIYRLDQTMKSSEAAVDMMANMQMAFNISLSSFLPKEQQLSQAEIQQLANQNRSHMVSQYRNQTREVLLYTYQDFTNDELRELDMTLASQAGQEFVQAINDGIKKGMFASSLDLGDALGSLLPKEHQGSGI